MDENLDVSSHGEIESGRMGWSEIGRERKRERERSITVM